MTAAATPAAIQPIVAPGQAFCQLGTHGGGILGPLILTAVGHRNLRCVKRRDGVVVTLVGGGACQAGGGLFHVGAVGMRARVRVAPASSASEAVSRAAAAAYWAVSSFSLLMAFAMSLTKAEVFGSAGTGPARFCV